jgi:hypothetical protein
MHEDANCSSIRINSSEESKMLEYTTCTSMRMVVLSILQEARKKKKEPASIKYIFYTVSPQAENDPDSDLLRIPEYY